MSPGEGVPEAAGAADHPEGLPPGARKRRARWLYVRVVVVQVVALVLLWLLQAAYGS